jgi:hypothetical protein
MGASGTEGTMKARDGDARIELTVVSAGKPWQRVLDEIHFVLRGAAILSVAPPAGAESIGRQSLAPRARWLSYCYGLGGPVTEWWVRLRPGVEAQRRC